jgi:superfamily I DNA/RNA helicase
MPNKPTPKRTVEEILAHQTQQRAFSARQIIDSTSSKKIIVSGPGTGKTYIFNEIIKRYPGDCLAITFINNLANKLKRELPGRVKSCTFHSCCRQLLHKNPGLGIDTRFYYLPQLREIIQADAQLCGHAFDFTHCFKRLESTNPALLFFLNRSNYYNAVSFDDSVYRALKFLEKHPGEIPVYDHILVDEYQDFNPLEATFIDLLSTKSRILIVGDDDQALYSGKDASSRFIRDKFKGGEYEPFQLPYCSRCTQVVVDALDDVVSAAKRIGKLIDRVDKEYHCYLPDKIEDSKKYPRIIYATCSVQKKSTPYVAQFIDQEISRLSPEQIIEANKKGDYTVLVAGPSHYLDQIYPFLKKRLDWEIRYPALDNKKRHLKLTLLEGYKVLLDRDVHVNLGWRILLELDPFKGKDDLLRDAFDHQKQLYDCLPGPFCKKHEDILNLLREVREKHPISHEDETRIKSIFKIELVDLQALLATTPAKDEEVTEDCESNKAGLSIILTSYVGCKGLSAGYVFIVGLEEGNLPRNNQDPTDFEICQIIVALTRTIKRCYLISTCNFGGKFTRAVSQFVQWINPTRITSVKVDKKYWQKTG